MYRSVRGKPRTDSIIIVIISAYNNYFFIYAASNISDVTKVVAKSFKW